MGQPKDKELGIRNPIDLRVGQDVERFVGVVSQQDPGAIPRNAFQRARNMRLRGGMPVERGGQQKVITTPIASQWDGLRDMTTTEGSLRLYMPGTVYSGPWSHEISASHPTDSFGIVTSYFADPVNPYFYGLQYANTSDGLWLRIVRWGRLVTGEPNLIVNDGTTFFGVGLSSGTVATVTAASLLDDVGTGTLLGTLLISGYASGTYTPVIAGIANNILVIALQVDTIVPTALNERFYDFDLGSRFFSLQYTGDPTIAGFFTLSIVDMAYWQTVRYLVSSGSPGGGGQNAYYSYPSFAVTRSVAGGGAQHARGRCAPEVILGTNRYLPCDVTAGASPYANKLTSGLVSTSEFTGVNGQAANAMFTDGANVYILGSTVRIYNGATWSTGSATPANIIRGCSVYYGGRIHFVCANGGINKDIFRNTTANDFTAFSNFVTLATTSGARSNMMMYVP